MTATFSVAEHGKWLGTRRLAATIRDLVEAQLTRLDDGEQLALDFTDVEAVTGAFADELVAELCARHGRRITTAGANEEVAETIGLAMSRRTGTT